MASKAKIAGRSKDGKVVDAGGEFTVVATATGKRVFPGNGVSEARANELSENLLADSYVVRIDELDAYGVHQVEVADAPPAVEDEPVAV
jgi:hypothetical protein